jgi:hypothetical protein
LQRGDALETDQAVERLRILHAIDAIEPAGHEGSAPMRCRAGAPVFANLRPQQIEWMNMFA